MQDPQEADFRDTPRSAVANGMVDYILPVADLPAALITYWRNAASIQLPIADSVAPTETPSSPALPKDDVDALREIFALVRTRTNHDFSQYKRPTLLRRVARRMQVHGVTDLPAYLEILRAQSDEIQALLRDLLIIDV